MKVLLDECLPQKLRLFLPGHDVQSARFAGFSGKKNGELLQLAEDAGFEVLVTADQGIPFQNSMEGRSIAPLILKAPSNDSDTLGHAAESLVETIAKIRPGAVIVLRIAPEATKESSSA